MTKTLKWFNEQYEKILHSDLPDIEKGKAYGELMSQMEKAYGIPIIKSEEREAQNRAVIALYRKLSISRNL